MSLGATLNQWETGICGCVLAAPVLHCGKFCRNSEFYMVLQRDPSKTEAWLPPAGHSQLFTAVPAGSPPFSVSFPLPHFHFWGPLPDKLVEPRSLSQTRLSREPK